MKMIKRRRRRILIKGRPDLLKQMAKKFHISKADLKKIQKVVRDMMKKGLTEEEKEEVRRRLGLPENPFRISPSFRLPPGHKVEPGPCACRRNRKGRKNGK